MASAVRTPVTKTPVGKGGPKKSDFIYRVKFRNVLPDVPYDAKCLELPFDSERFVQYQTTSLERQHRHQLFTEPDLGIPINLIDTSVYKPIPGQELDLADAELIQTDTGTADARNKRADPFRASVPWLIKTTYISHDYDVVKRGTSGFERAHGHRMRQTQQQEDTTLDADTVIRNIEKSFEQAREEPVHPVHPNLKASAVYPILPDPSHEESAFLLAIFDEDPRRMHNVAPDIQERLAESLLVGDSSKSEEAEDEAEENEQKPVTLMVPAPGSRKRLREEGSTDTMQEYLALRDYFYEFKRENNAHALGFPNMDEVPSGTPVYYYKMGTRVVLRKKKKEKLANKTEETKQRPLRLLIEYDAPQVEGMREEEQVVTPMESAKDSPLGFEPKTPALKAEDMDDFDE